MSLPLPIEIIHRWRTLMLNRYRSRDGDCAPLVLMSYLTYAPVREQLIALDRFLFVLLYEERGGGYLPEIRFAGFGGRLQAGTIRLGGARQCRFLKDVALQPRPLAGGARLNLQHVRMTRLALRMEGRLQREKRHWHRPRREQLPSFCSSV
jgi:hypothetical protein